MADYGKRLDGTNKGTGWYGELPMQDGSNRVATEISLSFDYGNGDVLVPMLNPYLSNAEKLHLLQGKEPTRDIMDKTGKWGYDRIQQGRNPFIEPDETPIGLENYTGRR